jgi:MoaA/NifB/PqqE/SkfB family radical SAM enzyme
MKNVKFFAKLSHMKLTGRSFPISVIINVTNRCNSMCKHCYAAYYTMKTSTDMTTAEINKVIKELGENGCQRISFGGGEPLLRNDIEELIDSVISNGMSCTLNSNGILVPKKIDILRNLDALAISLDGRPENHDAFRGTGTGDRALAAITAAVEAGIRIHTNTVLHKYNLGDVDYILDLAGKYGFKAEFNLVITNIFGDGASPEDVKPTTEEFRNVLRYIIKRKKEGAPILFSAAAYESVLNCWKDFGVEGIMNESPPAGMPECPAGKFYCLIAADGTLWACPHLIGKIEAKNVLEVGVAEAWRIATSHPCTGCYQVYHHEFSRLMNLDPRVIWNYFKSAVGLN